MEIVLLHSRLESARALYTALGVNILLLEYRGYGKSTSSPSERGIYYYFLSAKLCIMYVCIYTYIHPCYIDATSFHINILLGPNSCWDPGELAGIFCSKGCSSSGKIILEIICHYTIYPLYISHDSIISYVSVYYMKIVLIEAVGSVVNVARLSCFEAPRSRFTRVRKYQKTGKLMRINIYERKISKFIIRCKSCYFAKKMRTIWIRGHYSFGSSVTNIMV